ncbi:MAG: hypothetical protein HQL80_11025 [Magnetococcales bacterium]|nr:hypothetical protein [Magnetococcales bacterium]
MNIEVETQFGFVAILDVLGARGYNVDHAKEFILNRDAMLDKLKEKPILDAIDESLPMPYIATFGDTVIFTWNVGQDRVMKTLPSVASWLSALLNLGIANKMLLRGALSVGEFISRESTVLGPAVSDAASWYEEADWVGVVLTTKCKLSLISLLENAKHNQRLKKIDFNKWFVEYDVLCHSGKKRMWVVSWPYNAWAVSDDEMTAIEMLSVALSDFSIPKGTEMKYENTLQFFR